MNLWRKLAPIAGAALIALVAGCGQAEEPASTVTGDPIRIGFVCSCSGAQSHALGRTADVAEAWAKSVNASGGINGHPVEVILKDDGLDAARSLQSVKELVENDKVMAISGEASLVSSSWVNYLADKKVPVVGGLTFSTPYETSPDFFSTGASLTLQEYGAYSLAKAQGAEKLGFLYCSDSPACKDSAGVAEKIVKGLGMEIVSAPVSSTAPNYTAQCLQMRDEGVDALMILNSGPVQTRVLSSCAQQGYTPTTVSSAGGSSDAWTQDPNFDGRLMASAIAPWQDESVPGVRTFLDAIDTFAPDLRGSELFQQPAALVWAGLELFKAAAEGGGVGPQSTPADVRNGLYGLVDETLDGWTAPLNFHEGETSSVPCYFVMGIEDGAFVSPEGVDPICVDEGVYTGLKALRAR